MTYSIVALILLSLTPLYCPSNIIGKRQSAVIILSFLASFLLIFIISHLKLNFLEDDVSNAISHSAFWGPSKKSELALFISMVFFFCIISFIVLKLSRKIQIKEKYKYNKS